MTVGKALPVGWKIKKLAELSDIKTGGKNNQDKTPDGKYPFFVRSDTVLKIDSYSHDGEAVLVPGEGRVGEIFHYINGKFDVHQRVYKISNFSTELNGRYLHYYLQQFFAKQASSNAVKATVDSLRLPMFQSFEVLLPTIKEQVRIVEILNTVDEEIRSTQQVIDQTLLLKNALTNKLLVSGIGHNRFHGTPLGVIPEDWLVGGFIDLTDSENKNAIKPGPFGSSIKKQSYVEAGYKVYGQEQVISGDPFFGDYYIDREKYNALQAFKVKEGDVLMSLVGTIGKVLIIPEGYEEGIINPRLMKISPDKEKASPEFIAYLLASDLISKQLTSKSHGGTMSIINKGMLLSVKIPIPPVEEQVKIVNIFESLDAKIAINKSLRNQFLQLKKGLMKDLLSGKVKT